MFLTTRRTRLCLTCGRRSCFIGYDLLTLPLLRWEKLLERCCHQHQLIRERITLWHKRQFRSNRNQYVVPYCGCVHVLSAVGYLRLIGVVSRANHRTGGGRDVSGSDGAGARFADRQPLLFKSNTFTDTTGTPLGMRGGGNPRTTWHMRHRLPRAS